MTDLPLKLWIAMGQRLAEARGSAERGQGTVEYSLLLTLVALVGIVAWKAFAQDLNVLLDGIATSLDGVQPIP